MLPSDMIQYPSFCSQLPELSLTIGRKDAYIWLQPATRGCLYEIREVSTAPLSSVYWVTIKIRTPPLEKWASQLSHLFLTSPTHKLNTTIQNAFSYPTLCHGYRACIIALDSCCPSPRTSRSTWSYSRWGTSIPRVSRLDLRVSLLSAKTWVQYVHELLNWVRLSAWLCRWWWDASFRRPTMRTK